MERQGLRCRKVEFDLPTSNPAQGVVYVVFITEPEIQQAGNLEAAFQTRTGLNPSLIRFTHPEAWFTSSGVRLDG